MLRFYILHIIALKRICRLCLRKCVVTIKCEALKLYVVVQSLNHMIKLRQGLLVSCGYKIVLNDILCFDEHIQAKSCSGYKYFITCVCLSTLLTRRSYNSLVNRFSQFYQICSSTNNVLQYIKHKYNFQSCQGVQDLPTNLV